ncbi:MAG: HNH endonuclease [Nitrosomonas sp.]|nr:HNH endonuclease [Nitrosomonas sp.]
MSDEEIIGELKEVAKYYGLVKFTRHEFDKVAKKCKGTAVLSRFGSWEEALSKTGFELKKRSKKARHFILESELMVEMARVFETLGHRPSKTEWEALKPKFSYTTYKTRYKGWVNAWRHFFENFKGIDLESEECIESIGEIEQVPIQITTEEKRTIPLKLRLRVLQRDNFKCVYCGASPATDSNIQLHIDHIVPFSKGGKTEFANLQTLCQNCNWGKGDDET